MKVSKNFVAREVAGEFIVIPVREAALTTNGIIGLSESGVLLFQKLQQDCTREELIQALLQEYDADPDEVWQDVGEFLDQMQSLGMLEGDIH